ncbi:MAG: hypothetical protein WCO57_15930 [Verrucomicrobiota bacterium]
MSGLFALAAACILGQSAQATTYYWDTNGTTAGSGVSTGTMGSAMFWSTDSSGSIAPTVTTTTTSDDLNFSAGSNGTAGTVTVSGVQSAGSLTFAQPGAITLTSGTISLGTGAITQSSGAGANIINSTILFNGNTITNNSTSALTLGGGEYKFRDVDDRRGGHRDSDRSQLVWHGRRFHRFWQHGLLGSGA